MIDDGTDIDITSTSTSTTAVSRAGRSTSPWRSSCSAVPASSATGSGPRPRVAARRGRCWPTCCWPSGRRAGATWPSCSSPTPTTRWARCAGRWPSCAGRSGCPQGCGGDPVCGRLRRRRGRRRGRLTVDHARRPAQLLDVGGELLEGVEPARPCPGSSRGCWWSGTGSRRRSRPGCGRRRSACSPPGDAAEASRTRRGAVARNPLEEGNHELLVRSLGDARRPDRRAAAGRGLRGPAAAGARRRAVVGRRSARRRRAASELGDGAAAGRPGGGGQPARRGPGRDRRPVRSTPACSACAGRCRGGRCRRRRAAGPGAGRAGRRAGARASAAATRRAPSCSTRRSSAATRARRPGDRRDRAPRARVRRGAGRPPAHRRRVAGSRPQALAETDDGAGRGARRPGHERVGLADYPTAFAAPRRVGRPGRALRRHRQQAWSLSLVARAHLLRDERSQAGAAWRGPWSWSREQRWMAFLPVAAGAAGRARPARRRRRTAAAEGCERAWALACQLGDPCWEGIAGRGLGLLHAAPRRRRRPPRTGSTRPHRRCTGCHDRYQWVHGLRARRCRRMAAAAGTTADRADAAPRRARSRWPPAATCGSSSCASHLHRWTLGDRTARGRGPCPRRRHRQPRPPRRVRLIAGREPTAPGGGVSDAPGPLRRGSGRNPHRAPSPVRRRSRRAPAGAAPPCGPCPTASSAARRPPAGGGGP